VLGGSGRRAANRLRVTAQLTDARNGYNLWSETYDREMGDVFAVEDEISHAIMRALQVHLVTGDSLTLLRRPTHDVEAYELYLKGRYFYNEGGLAPVQQALAYFQQALAHDSKYALAYAGLADAYQSLTASTYLGPREGMPKARAAVLKALALEPGFAQAHMLLALALAGKGRYAEALAEARKMGALAGDAPNFVGILGYVAGRAGERAEAQQILTALERRPPGNRAFAIALVHL